MELQFRDLIVTPVMAAENDLVGKSIVVIIDALDECADQFKVSTMLSIISQHSSSLPLKFFITSRPEQLIQQKFNGTDLKDSEKFHLHDVEESVVSEDIRIYVRERLRKIAADFDLSSEEWPPKHELDALVYRSAKLFIYAATVCEYVAGGGNMMRLRLTKATRTSVTNLYGKTGQLDNLYGTILREAYTIPDTEEQGILTQVLRAVISAHEPLSIDSLAMLLNFSCDEIYGVLSYVHSVIVLPKSQDYSVPITIFHASFPDYLADSNRSGEHFLDTLESHSGLAHRCLKLMQDRLEENICHLNGRLPNAEIPASAIKDRIPNGLIYACIYWASHVTEAKQGSGGKGDLTETLHVFFNKKVLQWIECLSVTGQLDSGIRSLRKLETWAMASHSYCAYDFL